jgi:hypothetical protein
MCRSRGEEMGEKGERQYPTGITEHNRMEIYLVNYLTFNIPTCISTQPKLLSMGGNKLVMKD